MRARIGESGTELSRRMTGSFREEEIRWAHSDAVLKYYNPGPETLRVQVEMWLSAPDERKLELHCNRVKVAELALDEHPRLLELQLILMPGLNRLDFITDRPAVRVSEERWSLRALALHELVWNIESLRPVEQADK